MGEIKLTSELTPKQRKDLLSRLQAERSPIKTPAWVGGFDKSFVRNYSKPDKLDEKYKQ